MPTRHLLLALLVVVIWGFNFIFIKLSLDELSPLFLCALRFFLAAFPAVLFIKPRSASFKMIILYGLLMFGLQFSLMFLGIKAGMTPGLASILVQVQIFFSMFFVAIFLNEKPTLVQIIGALVSFIGISIIALHFDSHTVSVAGFLLIIGAAAAWGLGNLVTKKMIRVNMIELVVWGSFVACFPLLILSLIFEGPDNIKYSIQHISWLGIISILYIVYASTWIGYGVWSHLISRYPVATIVPFTLLVPIFGMLSSAFILNEPLDTWKIVAGMLVLAGLCINLFGTIFLTKK